MHLGARAQEHMRADLVVGRDQRQLDLGLLVQRHVEIARKDLPLRSVLEFDDLARRRVGRSRSRETQSRRRAPSRRHRRTKTSAVRRWPTTSKRALLRPPSSGRWRCSKASGRAITPNWSRPARRSRNTSSVWSPPARPTSRGWGWPPEIIGEGDRRAEAIKISPIRRTAAADNHDAHWTGQLSSNLLRRTGPEVARDGYLAPKGLRSAVWGTSAPSVSKQLGNHARGSLRPVVLHQFKSRLCSEQFDHRLRDHVRTGIGKFQPAPGAIAIEAMGDVEILLEVIAQRKIDEGGAGRRQFHAGSQPALHQREVTCGEMSIEIRHERRDFNAFRRVQRFWIDAGTCDHDHAQFRDFGFRGRPGLQDTFDQMAADPGAAHGDDANLLVRRISQRLPQLRPPTEVFWMLAHYIAREIEMLRHPFAHSRQILAEGERNDVRRLADEDRAVPHGRMPLDMLDHLGIVIGREKRLVLAAR